MKNSILYCLAAASMVLSFFFEQAPAASGNLVVASSQQASLLSGLLPADEGDNPRTLSTADSVAYDKVAERLGIETDYNENKSLLATVASWLGTPYRYGSNSKSALDSMVKTFITHRRYIAQSALNLVSNCQSG